MEFFLTEEQIEKQVFHIKESSTENLIAYNSIIQFFRKTLDLYKEGIREMGFDTIEDEILFFKYIKQVPQSNLIYYLHLRTYELVILPEQKARKKHILKKMGYITHFFQVHAEFNQYLKLDQDHFDEYYFTRTFAEKNELLTHHLLCLDKDFNTSHDLLLSEIKALQMFLTFLQKELKKMETVKTQILSMSSKLEWTDSKAALTELIYALHTNGSINKGKTDLVAIASVFEEIFNVKLDNIYKTYSEIKSRKSRRTKFLDELTWNMEQKLNKEEGL